MDERQIPDSTLLNKLLRYEPETGKLFWRSRTPDMFEEGKQTREHSCANWNAKHAGKEAFTADSGEGYKRGVIFGRKYLAHRVIWCMVKGYWPDQVDHENQGRSDNRIGNLRDVDQATNLKNMRLPSTNTSGRVGVCWNKNKGKWHAQIRHNSRQINLGLFTDVADAEAAREAAEQKYGFHPNHGRRG